MLDAAKILKIFLDIDSIIQQISNYLQILSIGELN